MLNKRGKTKLKKKHCSWKVPPKCYLGSDDLPGDSDSLGTEHFVRGMQGGDEVEELLPALHMRDVREAPCHHLTLYSFIE